MRSCEYTYAMLLVVRVDLIHRESEPGSPGMQSGLLRLPPELAGVTATVGVSVTMTDDRSGSVTVGDWKSVAVGTGRVVEGGGEGGVWMGLLVEGGGGRRQELFRRRRPWVQTQVALAHSMWGYRQCLSMEQPISGTQTPPTSSKLLMQRHRPDWQREKGPQGTAQSKPWGRVDSGQPPSTATPPVLWHETEPATPLQWKSRQGVGLGAGPAEVLQGRTSYCSAEQTASTSSNARRRRRERNEKNAVSWHSRVHWDQSAQPASRQSGCRGQPTWQARTTLSSS